MSFIADGLQIGLAYAIFRKIMEAIEVFGYGENTFGTKLFLFMAICAQLFRSVSIVSSVN